VFGVWRLDVWRFGGLVIGGLVSGVWCLVFGVWRLAFGVLHQELIQTRKQVPFMDADSA